MNAKTSGITTSSAQDATVIMRHAIDAMRGAGATPSTPSTTPLSSTPPDEPVLVPRRSTGGGSGGGHDGHRNSGRGNFGKGARIILILVIGAVASILFNWGMNYFSSIADQGEAERQLKLLEIQERQLALRERASRIPSLGTVSTQPVKQLAKATTVVSEDCSNGNEWESSNPQIQSVSADFSVSSGCAKVDLQFAVTSVKGNGYQISASPVPGRIGNYLYHCTTEAGCIALLRQHSGSPIRFTVQNGGQVTILQ